MHRYGSLCTEFYDLDKPEAPPDALEYYLSAARRASGPILEPMCGSGRFLLPLLVEGFDAEGVDLSSDMLEACRQRARALGVTPTLHQQALERLELSRQFGLVFIPSGSFCLLTDDASVDASLRRIHAAMLPGATFLVEIERWIPREPTSSGNWGGRWVQRPDGSKIIINWLSQYSGIENISRSIHRYELVEDGRLVETQYEDFELRCYDPLDFVGRLERTGFAHIEQFSPYRECAPDADDDAIVFRCIKS